MADAPLPSFAAHAFSSDCLAASVDPERIEPRLGARMRRRELVLFLATGMMAARAVRAQQKAMPVIGFLGGTSRGALGPLRPRFARN
jgi:hypothetical protein